MSCSSSTIITPRFLKGKSKDDLAPTTNFILLFAIPFQIILLFFGVILECHIAGSNPKKFENLDYPAKPRWPLEERKYLS